MKSLINTSEELLKARAKKLNLYGILLHWDEINNVDLLKKIIDWEEAEKLDRGMKTRITKARLGKFKSISNFDWGWPKMCDRKLIEECLTLKFIKDATNIILCGPNGVGKSTIARNICYQSALKGHAVLFITAGQMLNDLGSQEGSNGLARRIKYYSHPAVLCIDEVGYLSYSNRHADLLFQIIAQRYQEKPTLITTNKVFSEWASMFPNATCVVPLIDRLVHNSEIITIEGDSFRLKEAKEKRLERKENREKNNDQAEQQKEVPS